jgi:hypothetical protein
MHGNCNHFPFPFTGLGNRTDVGWDSSRLFGTCCSAYIRHSAHVEFAVQCTCCSGIYGPSSNKPAALQSTALSFSFVQGEVPGTRRVFQKEIYNFEILYEFIHRTCTEFSTVIMQQNRTSFTWDSYGSMRLPLVMQGVSKRDLQWYSKC